MRVIDGSSNQELERRFVQHGISPAWLYAWWYRLLHRLGQPIKPPVLLTLREQILYAGLVGAAAFGFGGLILWLVGELTAGVVYVFVTVVLAKLPINAARYRAIRRRIVLQQGRNGAGC